jgi:hypothetical protein
MKEQAAEKRMRIKNRIALLFAMVALAAGGGGAPGIRSLAAQVSNDSNDAVAEKAPAPADGLVPPARAQVQQSFDFRRPLDDLPLLTVFGPDAAAVVHNDAQGLRIRLPAGRTDCRNVGVELPVRIRGDFDVDLGFELLAIGDAVPNPAAGVQMRLVFDDPAMPLVALARFRNRYPPQRAPLFGVVGHDGETFAAYRITILPDWKEKPRGIDVRANEPRGRLRLIRTGPQLDSYVSDGDSPYRLIQSELVGATDIKSIQAFAFSGWAPVAVDVRFSDLQVNVEAFADELPGRVQWSRGWLAAGLLLALIVTVGLGFLTLRRARR